jgi:acetate---CoA ligase (ADP-forming)
MSFESLFYPRGVAVIGSASPGKLGAVLLKQIIDGHYAGGLYAVNPKAQGAFGAPGFASVEAIGKPVDLVVIVSPAATVPDVLDDCGRAGVGAAVVITSGFGEMGNKAGEEAVLAAARRNGIRVVGPNCAGIVCTSHKLFPTLEVHPPAGGVALVSQSGALGGVVLAWAAEQGLGISKFVSYGNGIDINQVELLNYLKDDPETRVVALYIESIKEGRPFMEALEACCRVKPVVVIKAGRTQAGQRATASHTGSMAGADAVYDAALRQCGALRVKTVEEMLDLCSGFLNLPLPAGKRVIVVTNSGGPGVLAADMAEEVGLVPAEVSPKALETLHTFLPPHCGFHNPIDLTVEGNEETYRRTLLTVLDEYDAALAMDICPPYLDSMGHARGVADAAAASGKPVMANFLPNQVVNESVAFLKNRGIPTFSSGEKAVTVLAQMAKYAEMRDTSSFSTGWKGFQARANSQTQMLPGEKRMLEPEAMAWLEENGIPVPARRFISKIEDVAQACQEIGFPCVMKVVSPDILHKSEFGGVIVGIRSEEAARTAFETIRGRTAGKDFRGVIIYPQILGGQEVLLGLTVDPQFGPVVAFGLGGIYTEILRDISLRVAPIQKEAANQMIRQIKGTALLMGARGSQPCDLDTLAETLVNFSELPFRYPEIDEVDLNPVFLLPKGLVVGDVRVIRKA